MQTGETFQVFKLMELEYLKSLPAHRVKFNPLTIGSDTQISSSPVKIGETHIADISDGA